MKQKVLSIDDFEVGTKFKVNVSSYAGRTFTVIKILENVIIFDDPKNRLGFYSFDNDNLAYYSKYMTILGVKDENV